MLPPLIGIQALYPAGIGASVPVCCRLCGRRILCEQFNDGVLARYDRWTQRLETIVHHLGLALGGRPAAAFAERLMVPASNGTLLRVVSRRTTNQNDELTVIGIDDFAFRRGQTYGTIICDLARHPSAGSRFGYV